MANYFLTNRPQVVSIPFNNNDPPAVPPEIQVTDDLGFRYSIDDLQLARGEDDDGNGKDDHWVEYRVPGTNGANGRKRVGKKLPKGWIPAPGG